MRDDGRELLTQAFHLLGRRDVPEADDGTENPAL
jgi:hypothetical protein